MIREPQQWPISIGGKPVAYVAVGESPAEAVERMWARLCVGEPAATLPCGCTDWNTRHGRHRMRGSTCSLNGYEHDDLERWMGVP